MGHTVLFEDSAHKNILLEDFGTGGLAIQANQHIIVHESSAMLLDPGGHKIYNRVLLETTTLLGPTKLRYVFMSHQDPDVVAAANGWLMTTPEAVGYISRLWVRFVPHFGLDRLVEDRLKPIPDAGMMIDLDGCQLSVVPAHFLHAAGNHQVYDPAAKILYSGDLGASFGASYLYVEDFEAHLPHMREFHRRYMTANKMMRAWAKMARSLDIEIIAPQHGALFKGKPLVDALIDWCDNLECGIDLISEFTLP